MSLPHSPELLSPPVHVKWVTEPAQAADSPEQTLLTRQRVVVEAWARERHAEPATGKGKIDVNDGGTGLRFNFPGMGRFQPIAWSDWFREFDEFHLVFAYRPATETGQATHEYRIVTLEELAAIGITAPSTQPS